MTPSPTFAAQTDHAVRTQSDKLEIEAFVQSVEDRTARFVGAEFCAARLIAYVSAQAETGQLERDKAARLLEDAYHMAELTKLGHQAHKWLRKPPAALEMMVLHRNGRTP